MTAAVALLLPSAGAGAVVLSASDVTVPTGSSTAEVGIVLDSQEFAVAGTQNDITLVPPLRFRRKANDRPDCSVNPEINKGGTSFAFVGSECGRGECEVVRSLVLALDNVDAIADPALLYTCRLAVDEAAIGTYPVHLSNPGASDPDGNALEVDTVDGSVSLGGGEVAVVVVGDASVCGPMPGSVEVTYVQGPSLDSLSHDVEFQSQAPIAADESGRPRCAPVEPLDAAHATFAFVPEGCNPGGDCSAVRVFLRAELGAAAIESGMALYRCEIDPLASAEVGSYPLRCSNPVARNAGIPDLGAVCSDGSFSIGGCMLTPTPTSTAQPTQTPPSALTETPTAHASRAGTDDGGCAITPAPQEGPWVLLGALLLWSGTRRWRRGDDLGNLDDKIS